MKNNTKELLIFLFKFTTVLLIGIIFFCGFGLVYPSMLTFSRSLALTLFIFAISLNLFSNIYGNLEIGEFKSKQVIYSTALTVLFTDIVSYAALMVMQTNPNNIWANQTLTFENLHILLMVFIFQLLIIIISSYSGNYIYFRIYNPKNTLIIYDENFSNDKKIESYLKTYKKQYKILDSIDIRDNSLNTKLIDSDLVVFCEIDPQVRKNLVEVCYLEDIDIAFIPSISDVVEMSGIHTTFGDKPVVEVRGGTLTFSQRVLKRLMDISVSLIGIILTSPFWIVFMIAIKLDDNGPIFFSHTRKTINGKDFQVYKFRSMKLNSENISATENDDRITRVGKIIRKIRMDELPQLINILIGDMSLVGPRPEMIENINEYEKKIPEFRYRLKVKAGLTGIAQIEGKYNTLPKDKLILDLIYIENYSIWLDIKLLFKTVIIFFKKDSTEGFK